MERHALADAKTESIRFRRQTSAKIARLVHSTLTVLLLGVGPAHLAMLGEKKDFQFVACGDASRCPVGVGKELALEQVVLRNGGVEQLYNTEAKAKR